MHFMVLIDASTRWSHICLLSTRNVAFARLFAQIIRVCLVIGSKSSILCLNTKKGGPRFILFVWQLFLAFVLKYFYCSNTTQMLKNENNLKMFSAKLNMTGGNFEIKLTFFLHFNCFSLSFSSPSSFSNPSLPLCLLSSSSLLVL